jgi:ribonuclease HII
MKQKIEVFEHELVLGIDDAGRGPLIGAMALAGCLIDSALEEEFKSLGVKDSKLIQPKAREILAEEIRKKAMDFHVKLTHPQEIDSSITTGTNLNTVEAIRAAEIINQITKNRDDKIKVIIDCPSPNKEAWRSEVVKRIINTKNLLVICEHKADRDYIAVGAASILAKSEREKDVARIKEEIGQDFGSGYPSDPATKEFLKKYSEQYDNAGIFRKTWATYKEHKNNEKQKNLGEF